MTLPALAFTLLASLFLFCCPRRLAPTALLAGATYITLGPALALGPLSFYVLRIMVVVGLMRVMAKGEQMMGGWTPLDRVFTLWVIWVVVTGLFHEDPGSTLITRLGLASDSLGLYVLFRVFITDLDTIWYTFRNILLLLVPIVCGMLLESVTGRNEFSIFGGVSAWSEVRDGAIRAQGPFGGSILAGTVGAVCFPLALLFWKRNRRFAIFGMLATLVMVYTSKSSGPIMTLVFVLLGLGLWRFRDRMGMFRWAAVFGFIALALVMNAPVYYIIARIDFTGSSTSWHRAELMDAAVRNIGQWWLIGTDYTRHWMPTGIQWSGNHTDMTNHYLKMGVLGGLPLMLLFIGILLTAFHTIGRALRSHSHVPLEIQFMVWALGAILFAHSATFVSVSYHDQSVAFLYFALACIGSLPAALQAYAPPVEEQVEELSGYDAAFGHHS